MSRATFYVVARNTESGVRFLGSFRSGGWTDNVLNAEQFKANDDELPLYLDDDRFLVEVVVDVSMRRVER